MTLVLHVSTRCPDALVASRNKCSGIVRTARATDNAGCIHGLYYRGLDRIKRVRQKYIQPCSGSPLSLGAYNLLILSGSPATGGDKPIGRRWHPFPCSLKPLFFRRLGCLFLRVLICSKSSRRLKYLVSLRAHLSLDPRNGMEAGPCNAYRFISNSALSAFTNERDDVKAEQRTMGKIPLTSN